MPKNTIARPNGAFLISRFTGNTATAITSATIEASKVKFRLKIKLSSNHHQSCQYLLPHKQLTKT